MVMFCRKQPGPFAFRRPNESDMLGSNTRRHVLVPQHEVNVTQAYMRGEGWQKRILKSGATKEMNNYQIKGAVGHWEVMRTVIPGKVWETW